MKVAEGFGLQHQKPEYEDVARLAAQQGLPFAQVARAVEALL